MHSIVVESRTAPGGKSPQAVEVLHQFHATVTIATAGWPFLRFLKGAASRGEQVGREG